MYTFNVLAIVFSFENKLHLGNLLNSSAPVDAADEVGGELEMNEQEGDVDDGNDEGSSDSEGLDANNLYKSWEEYEDGHKLER